jgi:large subunit ribosomal protein L31
MKAKIHPTWYDDAVVTCTCGNSFTTGSTKKKIQVEICSACHPFFTGEMKYVDTMGRVEKFQQKQKAAKKLALKKKKITKMKKREERPETLREMLTREKKKIKAKKKAASKKPSSSKPKQ